MQIKYGNDFKIMYGRAHNNNIENVVQVKMECVSYL